MHKLLRTAPLSAKLGIIGAALLALALGSIALTLWVTWQLEGGAAAVNEAGRLRMQTWRLAQGVGSGDAARHAELVRQYEATLELLGSGDPARPLFVPRDALTRAAFGQVRERWAALRGDWQSGTAPSNAQAAARAEHMVAAVDAFVDAIEHRLARWTTLLTLFQLGLMALAIAGGVTLLYAAYLFVFNPLARLQAGLARIEAGDLGARVDVASHDEFGHLSQSFNRMAATLQGFYRDLEDKVRRKTETLRAERERLALLYDASAFVGRAANLQALAEGLAGRMRRAVHADAAMLRWRDGQHGEHVLLASEGVPAGLLEHERCLSDGGCHCVSEPQTSAVRSIPIRAADAGAPTPCERFGFDRMVAVPVRLHEQSLGEVNLLFRGNGAALASEDLQLLESLASHFASGMEGLRAAALEREAAVAEERSLIARELHDSIAQGLAFMKIQVQLLRRALERGEAALALGTVDEIDAGVRESTADVRELLLHFRTRTNGDDIVPALKTTLQKFHHQTGLETHIDVHGRGVPLAPDVQVQLLHVVQEALSNVRKHAGATKVWLDVQQQPNWRIEVRDDGLGFDTGTDAQPDETHVGLRIMSERAAGIGAQVHVRSAPGAGTRVVVSLPEREAQAA
ncbi:type IV pili methyl-accepting chemotaxis transducer N-terminal domain-containing protein [Caldimonas sp. KR1-144]|uniref:type IV pili methyl-accepting chemotaxis transducer N-terminal domain-containing protein n=1 Tax=Caldimonas sp. KR1-144 TaxID=3400911 RepID=UPI003C121B73